MSDVDQIAAWVEKQPMALATESAAQADIERRLEEDGFQFDREVRLSDAGIIDFLF